MRKSMDRRDFVKLLSLSPFLFLSKSRSDRSVTKRASGGRRPNILVLVFDTLAAQHMSLYGYPRRTTPNLERFAERATVYHHHISPGSFTNPGTASLLTGTYPWTHRSLAIRRPVIDPFDRQNLFSLFASDYYTFAYSQNLIVMTLLCQMGEWIDEVIYPRALSLMDWEWSSRFFPKDYDIAIWREMQFLWKANGIYASSHAYHLVRSRIYQKLHQALNVAYRDQFPRNLPQHYEQVFRMEEAIDWLGANLVNLKRPFLGYFHFYPPHAPYNPRAEFINRFDNGWVPAAKPSTPFSGEYAQGFLNRARLQYDEYVAYVDAEFGRLYDTLESQGVLDETVVIVTSDHGELFERGVWQHTTEMLYEPVIRIPMIVTEPGQDWRRDVRQPTSAVDVLPTLCEQTGCPVPAWCEGQVLPAFDRDAAESRRAVYAVDAKSASRRGPLEQGTIALWEGPYKLIHYFGYVNLAKTYELYDLEQDPEERVDCFGVRSEVGSRLQNRVLDQLQRINEGNLRTHHSMDESWSEGRIDHA